MALPLLIPAIIGGVVSAVGTIVGRVLVSLGIGYVTFTGVDLTLTWARDQFVSSLSGLPAGAIAMMGVLKVGVCVSMLLSALTMRMVLQGLTSGAVKRMVVK